MTPLAALRRRWRVVAVVLVLGAALAVVYNTVAPRIYSASTDVLVAPTSFDTARGTTEIEPEEVATQVRVVTSEPVADLTRRSLQLEDSFDLQEVMTAEALGTARVIRLTVSVGDAESAAAIANAAARAYLDYRRTTTQESALDVAESLAARERQLQTRIADIDRELAADNLNQRATQRLARIRGDLLSQQAQLAGQLAGLDVTVASGGAGGAVLRPAEVPNGPRSPQPVITVVLALMLALAAGAALAVLRDRLDTRVRSREDALRALPGALHLGHLSKEAKAAPCVTAGATVPAAVSREFHAVYLSMHTKLPRYRHAERVVHDGDVVVLTPGAPGKGPANVACNVAAAAARAGNRVLLVDTDLAGVGPQRVTGLPEETPGLGDVLSGGGDVGRYLQPGGVAGLTLLASGNLVAEGVPLLSSPAMKQLLEDARSSYDLVVLGAPPSPGHNEALELSTASDLVLLVVELGRSDQRTLEQLHRGISDVSAGQVSLITVA